MPDCMDRFFFATSLLTSTGYCTFALSNLSFIGKFICNIGLLLGGIGLSTFFIIIALYTYSSYIEIYAFASKCFDTLNIQTLKMLLKIIIITFFIIILIFPLIFYAINHVYFLHHSFSIIDACFITLNTFCNTGFSNYNIVCDQVMLTNIGKIISSLLMITGSLGFVFLYEAYSYLFSEKESPFFFSLTFKQGITIFCSSFLFVFTLLFFQNYSLIDCFFYASSLRCAGMYSTTILNTISPFYIIIILYNIIGGMPLSCGSGLKTSIIVSLYAFYKNFFLDEDYIFSFKKNISLKNIYKSILFTLYFIALSFLLCGTFSYLQDNSTFKDILIYSIGIITNSGIITSSFLINTFYLKLFSIIGMILGKLGIIILFIFQKQKKQNPIRYAEENTILT